MNITRGLLTENADGTFTCAVCIPASMIAAVLAGDLVKIGIQAPDDIAVKWADETAPEEISTSKKPETRGIATGGIDPPALVFGAVNGSHKELIESIKAISRDVEFQEYARAQVDGDPFSGGIQCAIQYIYREISTSHDPEAAFHKMMKSFKRSN